MHVHSPPWSPAIFLIIFDKNLAPIQKVKLKSVLPTSIVGSFDSTASPIFKHFRFASGYVGLKVPIVPAFPFEF